MAKPTDQFISFQLLIEAKLLTYITPNRANRAITIINYAYPQSFFQTSYIYHT